MKYNFKYFIKMKQLLINKNKQTNKRYKKYTILGLNEDRIKYKEKWSNTTREYLINNPSEVFNHQ